MSMSAFPSAVAALLSQGTLTLNALSSFDSDSFSPYSSTAGVRVLTTGAVQEIVADVWTSQNPGVEWIDDFVGGDSASNYEVQLVQSTSSGSATFSGPALSIFHTISTTRQWTWSKTTLGSFTWSGTMTLREIADTSNSVSASVIVSIENGF